MAYSIDLRVRVVAAHAECGSSSAVAATFMVSEAWVRRMTQLGRETGGDLSPRSTARTDHQRAYDDADDAAIRALIKAKPDATLAEVAEHLGKPAGRSSVSRALARLDLVRKKSPSTPPSRTGPTSRPSGPRGSSGSPTTASPT